MDNVLNNVDMTQLENMITELMFKSMTISNGIKNFQLVTDSEQLHIDGDFRPQTIFDKAPEQAIISIDTPAIAQYPNGEAGHLFAITGNMPTRQESRPTPILCFWISATASSDLYIATYMGNGSYFKWRKISTDYESLNTLQNTNGDITMHYRVIAGRFVEFSLRTEDQVYSTATTLFTLPFKPLEGRHIYFPMAQWLDDAAPSSGNNVARIGSNGEVQVICSDQFLVTHGVFAIA